MRLISTAPLAIAVSRAGGLGFLGCGTDVSTLPDLLSECAKSFQSSPIPNTPKGVLPIGVGFICWGASLPDAVKAIEESELKPAAVWLFAPEKTEDLVSHILLQAELSSGENKSGSNQVPGSIFSLFQTYRIIQSNNWDNQLSLFQMN